MPPKYVSPNQICTSCKKHRARCFGRCMTCHDRIAGLDHRPLIGRHTFVVKPHAIAPSSSWWVGKDRQGFREEAAAQLPRMQLSTVASVIRPITVQ